MNDRHRTIERWKKKQAAKNKYVNESFLSDFGAVIARALNILYDELKKVCNTLWNFAKEIKDMPEDEFQKKLEELRPQLTDEQIKLLHKIRGDGNNDKPNSEA